MTMTTPDPIVRDRARRTSGVLGEVAAERGRQDARWGEQNHVNGTGPDRPLFGRRAEDVARAVKAEVDKRAREGTLSYAGVLLEEVAEAFAEADPARLRAELIQVAAVAVAFAEKIDREGEAAQ